jgi:hypothetical protein
MERLMGFWRMSGKFLEQILTDEVEGRKRKGPLQPSCVNSLVNTTRLGGFPFVFLWRTVNAESAPPPQPQ